MFLNCKTWFSYRYGTYPTQALVDHARQHGIDTLAITNINNTTDVWDFVRYCEAAGIRPIAGAEIRNGDQLLYLLLARNEAGFFAINSFLSIHQQKKEAFPPRPDLPPDDVWVIYAFGSVDPLVLMPHEKMGVHPAGLPKLYRYRDQHHAGKFVIQYPVTFAGKLQHNIHRLLRAIDKNILLSQQDKRHLAAETEVFTSPGDLLRQFSAYPEIIGNTHLITETCSIAMDFDKPKIKCTFTGSAASDRDSLERLAFEGMERRYGRNNTAAAARIRKELGIIEQQGFNAYFLITHDIVQYARHRGFFYVGRGSGANSMVAYCLQITEVDPMELDLYFERFLNPHRASPPDFDLDFSWKDRDEIIRYIFHKYGAGHVCLLGMFATFQRSALTRELGKVFGLPKDEIDELVRNPYASYRDDQHQRLIAEYGKVMTDFPNHLSIHAGGILISERPLHYYTATELPPKGLPTAQIDMHLAESISLDKIDVLSQRGLGHIRETIGLVRENKGIAIDISNVAAFKQDREVAARLRKADTIGCFYIESPAMRQLLQKLRCSDYLTLVAASSIIRPGVAQSGMMRQYIHRYQQPGTVRYLHPVLEELLKETFGIMVYQEDVIKVAHHFAGLDMAEADVLRRAMSGKYRGKDEIKRLEARFFGNCRAAGYAEELTAEVWRQIASFAGFSFSKAHSASFAVESYQSLYLKTYHPMEFMVAVINNFGGFYRTEVYFRELRKAGARVHAPCVNNSRQLTTIRGIDVYTGFIHIEKLEEALICRIANERQQYGSFISLYDFMERTGAGLEQLNILIRAGALRFTGKNKKELLWEANFLRKRHNPAAAGSTLFTEEPEIYSLPTLYQHPLDDALDELELLGFSLGNPFAYADNDGRSYLPARAMSDHTGKQVMMLGYLVTQKHIRTLSGEPMFFGTFIDEHGDWIDTVHFPEIARRYALHGSSGGFYRLSGIVLEEFGTYSLQVQHMERVGNRAIE